MKIYKCFFKILKKQKGQIIMYLGIFIVMCIAFSSQGGDSAGKKFQPTSLSYALFDEDDSEISRGMAAYLGRDNDRVEIEDTRETIQDEMYNRNVHCVIRIREGFGDAIRKGEGAEMLEITAVPGAVYGEMFEGMLSGYARILDSYLAGGFTDGEAVRKTEEALAKETEVRFSDDSRGSEHSEIYYYYNYVPYIFIAIVIVAIGPILILFHKKDIRERIQSSPYPAGRMNMELYAGMVTAGFGLTLVHLVIVTAFGANVFSRRGGLFVLNEICFLIMVLGLTFMIGQIVTRQSVLSMVANVIGLGMSFLGGVFVPLSLLGDGIIRVAHFLPSYWYVKACETIDFFQPGSEMRPIMGYMGMQLLFAFVFVCAGMAFDRRKR